MTRANVQTNALKRAYFDLGLEILDLDHLNRTLDTLRRLPGVIHVERVKEYSKKRSNKKPMDDGEESAGASGDTGGWVN
jgi:hypothetical protein